MHTITNTNKPSVTFLQTPYPEENTSIAPHNTVHLTLIAGDASDRKFYRLNNASESAICMRFPKWDGGYGGDPISWLGMHHALKSIGIPVPNILGIDEARCCIWTEDFGDHFLNYNLENQTLDKSDPSSADTLKHYCDSLNLLIKTQYPSSPIPDHPAQKLAFDFDKLLFEMRFFVTHFLNGFLGLEITETDSTWKHLFADFTTLCKTLDQADRVLCHRDYHVRNIMISENQVKWIDFQDARMGPHTYDVVSLVRDSYVNVTEETREFLFSYYFRNLNETRKNQKLPPMPLDAFVKESLYMGAQRNIKALGSFGYLATQKKKPSYLRYVSQTLQTILHKNYAENPAQSLRDKLPCLFNLLAEINQGKYEKKLNNNLDLFLINKAKSL